MNVKSVSNTLAITVLSIATPVLSRENIGSYSGYRINAVASRMMSSPQFNACVNSTVAASVSEQHKCYDVEMKRLEGINKWAYHSALVRLKPAERLNLRRAERHWAETRNDACMRQQESDYRDKKGNFVGGTDAAFELADCKIEETKRRNQWLSEL